MRPTRPARTRTDGPLLPAGCPGDRFGSLVTSARLTALVVGPRRPQLRQFGSFVGSAPRDLDGSGSNCRSCGLWTTPVRRSVDGEGWSHGPGRGDGATGWHRDLAATHGA